MRKWISLLLALTMLLSAAAALAEALPDTMRVDPQPVTAKILEINKHGNIHLDFKGSAMLEAGWEYGDLVSVTVGGKKWEMPIGSSFSDVDQGHMACLLVIRPDMEEDYVSLAINMGNFTEETGLAVKETTEADPGFVWIYAEGLETPDEITIEMKEAGGYYDQWAVRQLKRTVNREDYPHLTDAEYANFRMVKAGEIAEGRLYRASSPVNPEIGRNTCADKAAEEAGVRTVINLADSEEDIKAFEGYAESYCGKQKTILLEMGMDFRTEDYREDLAESLRFLAGNDGPYLVHCLEGKDRTGFVCAILECLAGATEEELITDYMLSYEYFYGVENGSEAYTAILENIFLKTLKTAFGLETLKGADLKACAEGYLASIGLRSEEITAIRDRICK